MEAENDRLNIVPRIDNKPIRQDAEETKSVLRGISVFVAEIGVYSEEILSGATKSTYGYAKYMSATIMEMNATAKQSVRESVDAAEQQMARLGDAASWSGFQSQIQTLQQYLQELEKQYEESRKSIEELPSGKNFSVLNETLDAQRKKIDEEKQALDSMRAKYDEISSSTLVNYKERIQQILDKLVAMRINGEQNTERYKELEQELGKLVSVQNEVQNKMKSDSSGSAQLTGLIQGLQGLMSAYSIGSGVLGGFVKDQEKLMQVQAKMQSVMEALMNLQTISNTLHATSTFRLQTLAKVQELYTLAVNRTKVALSSGSVAAKAFKLALASTGVGLLVIAIGALIKGFAKMKEQAKESAKEMEAFKASLDIKYAGTGQVAKATAEINAYITALENANLTVVEEKRLVDELNGKYGGLMGQYHSKADWLDALKTKTEDYINTLRLQAQAEEVTKQAMEAADKEEEAQKNVEEVTSKNQPRIDKNKNDYDYFVNRGNNQLASGLAIQNENLQKEIDDANKEFEEAVKKRDEAFKKLEELSTKLHGKQMSQPGATQSTAEEIQKQLNDIEQIRLAGQRSINANEIALMKEGKDKKLAEIEAERADMLAALDKERQDLDKKLKEAGQGGLSDADSANYATRETQINARQDAKVADVEKENTEAIAKMYRELGDVFVTEEQRKINDIKRRYEEQRKQLQKQKEGGSISEELYIDLVANVDKAEVKATFDYWLSEYGSYDQKRQALDDEWRTRLKNVPPEFAAEAQKQMTEALSKLDFEQFKKTIDWSGIFGDLSKQSSESLQYNLLQIQSYLGSNQLDMGKDEIKAVKDAIQSMTDELARRNPFAGLINAMQQLRTAKSQTVEAIHEIQVANEELTAAKEEQRLAEEEVRLYENEVDAEGETDIAEAKAEAQNRLTIAIQGVAAAEAKKTTAEKKGVMTSNNMAASYRKVASQMQSVKGVISGVAGDAKKLASVFSDEVGDGIGKAIDLFDTVIDSATNVINAIANTGKQVGEGITSTVAASSTAMQATSAAAATSIQTMEKASVILAVISAALQVATAIAGLFGNGDEQKQKEIESLQKRIDQLQWELDNAAIIRVQGGEGADSVVNEIRQKYIDAADEIGQAWKDIVGAYIEGQGFVWNENKYLKGLKEATDDFNGEKVKIVAKELVKDFSDIKYSADKVFGDDYWNQAAKNAQNYAEQMVLKEQQLEAEQGKKKTDDDKVTEYEQDIAELKQKINEEFNGVMEEIIGGSYQNIAEQLGDAFFEAFQNGEDAAAAWGEAVDKIVADVIKKMFIQQFLTENIAKIFDKYKEKWFDEDGSFVGWDTFQETMGDFSSDLKGASAFALEAFENMPEDIKALFSGDATRSAAEKGIQSMSQDSADEMNGRMTAIQGHTYSINENTKLLVQNSSAILLSVLDIQDNTERIYRQMAGLGQDISSMRAGIGAIGWNFRKIA